MAFSLYLSDIIKKAGLSVDEVLLIRHPLGRSDVKRYYEDGNLKAYTSNQRINFNRNENYWMVFTGENGTSAKFFDCYKVKSVVQNTQDNLPQEFPYPDWFDGNGKYFDIEDSDLFSDLRNRLIIDWGNGTRSWYQRATREKPILAIQEESKYLFTGFENVVLSFKQLSEIISDPIRYENWHIALKSVYAIYLIVDSTNGQPYIGSAYGKGGLLARWSCYINCLHGNNKGMIDTICKYPERYKDFQFSILQIIPKTATADEVIELEKLYKSKLLSKKFGMNEN